MVKEKAKFCESLWLYTLDSAECTIEMKKHLILTEEYTGRIYSILPYVWWIDTAYVYAYVFRVWGAYSGDPSGWHNHLFCMNTFKITRVS